MDWRAWRQYFEDNRTKPLPDLAGGGRGIEPEAARALARSLARFYLGEAGEGRIAREIDGCRLAWIDDDYRAALRLFVAEEGRHARILAGCVAVLGGRLIARTWTEALFRRGRRLLGIRLKLVVLLAAEVISLGFYGSIARALPAGGVREALRSILDDEERHLDFHAAFFAGMAASAGGRAAFTLAWFPVAIAACAVVLLDHAATLSRLGASPAAVAVELGRLILAGHRKAARRDEEAAAPIPVPVPLSRRPTPRRTGA